MNEKQVDRRIYLELQGEQHDEAITHDDVSQAQSSEPQQLFMIQDKDPYFGTCFVWGFRQNGVPRFSLGPHWPLFACTWTSFVVLQFFLLRMVWNNQENIIWFILTFLICGTQSLSYLATALLNPGIANSSDKASQALSELPEHKKIKIFCKKCNLLKDQSTVHCESCDVCIRGYDHHCPWTGKCIGQGNINPFNVFLGMTFFLMAYGIIITVITLLPPSRNSMRRNPPPLDTKNETNSQFPPPQ